MIGCCRLILLLLLLSSNWDLRQRSVVTTTRVGVRHVTVSRVCVRHLWCYCERLLWMAYRLVGSTIVSWCVGWLRRYLWVVNFFSDRFLLPER